MGGSRYNGCMTGPDDLRSLVFRPGVRQHAPATPEGIARAEEALALVFPADVRGAYHVADGADLAGGAAFLPLERVMAYAAALEAYGVPGAWGLVPVLDDGGSSVLCVACHAPLAGYVVRVPRYDVKQIEARSFTDALAALAVGEGGSFRNVFAEPERTARDVRVARALLLQSGTLGEIARRDAYRFATRLVSEQEVALLVPLLNEDEYVRENVLERLRDMAPGSAAAQAALRAAEEALLDFAGTCARILRESGMDVRVAHESWGPQVTVQPGGVVLKLEALFAARANPEFAAWLPERVRAIQALGRQA